MRMYARGDTSNVSIPALFTSHTTAHLLASLLPSEKTHPGRSPVDATRKRPRQQKTGFLASILASFGSKDTRTPPVSGTLDQISRVENNASIPNSQNTKIASPSAPGDLTSTYMSREGVDDDVQIPERENGVAKSSSALLLDGKKEHPGHQLVKPSSASSSPAHHPDSSSSNYSHEGLWVTLTPTNMSTSPFFDTLLVLVVSPLVTLTVVYALLLLRSRIRRRRWRAPKSLVERLPVRTYHTISDSSPSATPIASSPTTPLLQHEPLRPTSPHLLSRPGTESEVPATSSSTQHSHRTPEEEKRESGLAAWRRKYGGRQKECVVCLEEYVDGVSRVMSLPCGHEFHADCM